MLRALSGNQKPQQVRKGRGVSRSHAFKPFAASRKAVKDTVAPNTNALNVKTLPAGHHYRFCGSRLWFFHLERQEASGAPCARRPGPGSCTAYPH
jgi:hypothetical protein